jgi:hypothetical protein
MALASVTPKTETMLNEDNNEFSFFIIELIDYQEASNIRMETTWRLLSPQFLVNCDMWYPFHCTSYYGAFFVVYDFVVIILAIHK